ncbi:MAG: glycoside hydrolase family 3 protein [Lachnospiraceae bacterium]|nr:glycoside hydrolase family 3 protein [Lachnospiraceae bacterium]
MMDIYNKVTLSPFYLNEEDVRWIRETIGSMTLCEKVGQLFCVTATEGTEEELDDIFAKIQPGGITFRTFDLETAYKAKNTLDFKTKIPTFISANLEKGGSGVLYEGTTIGSPVAVAATGDVEMARKLATICGREGVAAGCTWAYCPITDLDFNWRNPITNTRTFGSNVDTVEKCAVEYIKEIQKCGIAATAKHFPGDGRDERDQHLVTTVNDLSCEDWDKTYGRIYRSCIEAGVLSVMVGQIMQPAWTKRLNPDIRDEDIMPATLSPELCTGLLRGHLGFNGVITTDATTMAGMTIPMKRREALPRAVNAGADVILFTRNLEEDFGFVLEAVESGKISAQRLEEALVRILALKAALGMHRKTERKSLEVLRQDVGKEEHRSWARECADKAITLVKEEKGVLPLSVKKYPRVLYFPIEADAGFLYSVEVGACNHLKTMLEKEGFQVTIFQPSTNNENSVPPYSYYEENFDLIIYCANMATKSNQTAVRIEWQQPMGANCPHWINSIPTIFISVENPYHLIDVPRIRTFINTYCSTDDYLNALVDKLMGRSEFKGISPVDAFCGKWDTRLQ